jgi:hypothetical protein
MRGCRLAVHRIILVARSGVGPISSREIYFMMMDVHGQGSSAVYQDEHMADGLLPCR